MMMETRDSTHDAGEMRLGALEQRLQRVERGLVGARRRSVRDAALEAWLLRAAGVLTSLRGWVVFLSAVIVLALAWSFVETSLQTRHFENASRGSAPSTELERDASRPADGGLGEAPR